MKWLKFMTRSKRNGEMSSKRKNTNGSNDIYVHNKSRTSEGKHKRSVRSAGSRGSSSKRSGGFEVRVRSVMSLAATRRTGGPAPYVMHLPCVGHARSIERTKVGICVGVRSRGERESAISAQILIHRPSNLCRTRSQSISIDRGDDA
jgi:hypothetical protein